MWQTRSRLPIPKRRSSLRGNWTNFSVYSWQSRRNSQLIRNCWIRLFGLTT
jgi:hypothetical protein